VRGLGPSITYLTTARLVLNMLHRVTSVFLPAIARGLGVSLEQAGFLVSARSLAGAATPAIVLTAGRGERRLRLIVWSLLLFSAGAAITAASGVYAGALAGFILTGLAKPGFDTAALAYVSDRTPYHRRARYLSIMELTWAGGLLIGAPAAGWLIGRIGWQAPFWAAATLGAIAVAAAPAFLDADSAPHGGKPRPLALNRSAIGLLAAFFVLSAGAEASFVVFGAWLEDEFALSLVALGAAAIVIGAAELFGEGTVLAFADRAGKRRMVLGGLMISTVGYVALSTTTDVLVAGLTILGVIFVAFEVTIVSAMPLASEVVPAARSRYFALIIVAVSIGRAGGAAVGPFVFTTGGMSANALVSAVGTAVALLIVWRIVEEPPRPLQPDPGRPSEAGEALHQ
jgi:MFS transporter, DHA1 family, inner membrane transport protein